MPVIQNDKDSYLQQAAERILPMPLPDGTTIDFDAVTGDTRPEPNATVGAPVGTTVGGTPAQDLVTTASLALQYAIDANSATAQIASDNKLTLDEKSALKGAWDAVYKERPEIIAMASNIGVNSGAYTTAYNNLYNYLQPLLGLNTTNTAFTNGETVSDITGQVLRDKVADYFTERQKIMNAAAIEASQKAKWSQIANDDGGLPQSGADKTGENVAAGFVGQGLLAKKDSVTGSDISVPALDNAGNLAANAVSANSISTVAMNAIVAEVGTLTVGDIIGTNSIDITGRGVFNGSYLAPGTVQAAITANNLQNAASGIFVRSGTNGNALVAEGSGTSGTAVLATAGSGGTSIGLSATASGTSSIAVRAINSQGIALSVQGRMTINNTDIVNNLNAEFLNGRPHNEFCQTIHCTQGTTDIINSGFSILFLGSLQGVYQTRGAGSALYMEDVSDKRKKKNIEDETLGLDFINQLRPRTYNMRDGNTSLKHHGFIAQEAGELFDGPNIDSLYTQNPQGTYGFGNIALIAPLVKAVQELTAEINLLKERLNG